MVKKHSQFVLKLPKICQNNHYLIDWYCRRLIELVVELGSREDLGQFIQTTFPFAQRLGDRQQFFLCFFHDGRLRDCRIFQRFEVRYKYELNASEKSRRELNTVSLRSVETKIMKQAVFH